MTSIYRQKTGVADTACVAMLCMATTMLLGISDPQQPTSVQEPALQAVINDKEYSTVTPDELIPGSVWNTIATDAEFISRVPEIKKTQVDVVQSSPAIRPVSLASGQPLEFVHGTVNSRVWLSQRLLSLDLLDANMQDSMSGIFHGVGFPEISTHKKPKPSPFAAPGPWARLVAWRDQRGEQAGVEPIARVRCMGLTPQAVAQRADRYRDMIYAYADKYEVNRHLVKAVITEESCFNNKALSPVGAQGLMQLMPDTAVWLKVNDPHDPAQNIRAGVRYLAALQKEFDTLELALAAYNAGPGNVRRYKGVPPFAETQAYVVKVQANYRRYMAADSMLNPVNEPLEQVSNVILRP